MPLFVKEKIWNSVVGDGTIVLCFMHFNIVFFVVILHFQFEPCVLYTNFFFSPFGLTGSLKIFLPVMVVALLVLIPVNVSGGTLLNLRKDVMFSDIDKLSISNVSPGSNR